VHDTTDLEIRGVPGVFVATVEFIDAAERQAGALGMDTARVFVAHPIQDRTREELEAMADAAVEQLVAALLA
jgi:hypothetical protein